VSWDTKILDPSDLKANTDNLSKENRIRDLFYELPLFSHSPPDSWSFHPWMQYDNAGQGECPITDLKDFLSTKNLSDFQLVATSNKLDADFYRLLFENGTRIMSF